jgi:hypothetical protein
MAGVSTSLLQTISSEYWATTLTQTVSASSSKCTDYITILPPCCVLKALSKLVHPNIFWCKHIAMKCELPFGHPSSGFHYTAVWFTAQMFHIRELWLRLKSNTGRIGAGVPSNESKTRLSGSPSLTPTPHSRGRMGHQRLQSFSLQLSPVARPGSSCRDCRVQERLCEQEWKGVLQRTARSLKFWIPLCLRCLFNAIYIWKVAASLLNKQSGTAIQIHEEIRMLRNITNKQPFALRRRQRGGENTWT